MLAPGADPDQNCSIVDDLDIRPIQLFFHCRFPPVDVTIRIKLQERTAPAPGWLDIFGP